jgi:hypothetical protein
MNQESETIYLNISGTETIGEIKKLLEEKTEQNIERLQISYEGNILQDDSKNLIHYKFKTGNHLELTISEKGEDEF